MRPFLICFHDATPAYGRETRVMIEALEPLVGRRIALGVVPDWHGAWPLTAHPAFCRLVRDASHELLLHGHLHRRERGWGPATWLAEGSDEMSGLDREETRRTIERGQRIFSDVFGERARGFLPPAWQRGHVRRENLRSLGLQHVLGFFSLEDCRGPAVPLATRTWDCGRWRWLGHAGDGIGSLLRATGRGVPVLAIHPRDLARGYWPRIVRLTRDLLEAGYEPCTAASLLQASGAEVAV